MKIFRQVQDRCTNLTVNGMRRAIRRITHGCDDQSEPGPLKSAELLGNESF